MSNKQVNADEIFTLTKDMTPERTMWVEVEIADGIYRALYVKSLNVFIVETMDTVYDEPYVTLNEEMIKAWRKPLETN